MDIAFPPYIFKISSIRGKGYLLGLEIDFRV